MLYNCRPPKSDPWHSTRQRHLLPIMSHLQPRSTPRHQTRTCRYHPALPTPFQNLFTKLPLTTPSCITQHNRSHTLSVSFILFTAPRNWTLHIHLHSQHLLPPTITALRFLTRTMNIPITHDTFTHHQPISSHYHNAYSKAATICPCLPQHKTRPHHPVLCQFCIQLEKSIPLPPKSPKPASTQCPTYAITPYIPASHTPYSSCITFALLTQNSYANCWDTIISQPTPIHNIPLSHTSQTPPTPPTTTPPTTTSTPRFPSHTNFSLAITDTTQPSSTTLPACTSTTCHSSATTQLKTFLHQPNQHNIHIPHQTLPLISTHFHRLASKLQQPNTQAMNEALIFHYMTAIGHPTNCQPKSRLFLHLNHLTPTITTNTYDHNPDHFSINLYLASNNP